MLRIALSTVAMIAACSSAKAHDFAHDLLCSVSGADGSPIVAWSFAMNTRNMDGSVGGTMIETSVHSHGRDISAAPGSRPIWVFESNPDGGLTLTSRSDPGWSVVAPHLVDSGMGPSAVALRSITTARRSAKVSVRASTPRRICQMPRPCQTLAATEASGSSSG